MPIRPGKNLLFDPRKHTEAIPVKPVIDGELIVGGRGPFSEGKAKGWLGGGTIAQATPDVLSKASGTIDKMFALLGTISLGRIESERRAALERLNTLYARETRKASTRLIDYVARGLTKAERSKLHGRLGVVFEENGTSALATVRHMIPLNENDAVLVTNDTGPAVARVLGGENPLAIGKLFQPAAFRLFGPPIMHKEQGLKRTETIILPVVKATKIDTDNEVVTNFEKALKDQRIKAVVVPRVTRVGRIMPTERIAEVIRQASKERGEKIWFVVDDIQTAGRFVSGNPLNYADFLVLGGGKGLGSLLGTAAVITDRNVLTQNALRLTQSNLGPTLRHYQFIPEIPTVQEHLARQKHHYAVSLPEISAFAYALSRYLGREKIYADMRSGVQRRTQNEIDTGNARHNEITRLDVAFENALRERVNQQRAEIEQEMSAIPGIKLVRSKAGAPIAPTIISFRITGKDPTWHEKLRQELMTGEAPITISRMAKEYLRIDLSPWAEKDWPTITRRIGEAAKKLG